MSDFDWRFMNACLGPSRGCAICGEAEFSPDIEAFETTGRLICSDCFEVLDETAIEELGGDE